MAIKDLKQRFTGTASDYISATSETQLQNQNISYWESLLQPAQQTLEASTKAAETQHGYDITNAYRNYLKQAEQITDSGLLDISKKQRTGMLQSAYEGAYLQSQANLASSYQKAQDEYSKAAAGAYSELEATAGKMKELDEYILENIENNYQQYGFTEEEINNMYKYNNETKQYEITDIGKLMYQTVFETVDQETRQNIFARTLKEENEDLWNFYLQNKDFVARTLSGIDDTTEPFHDVQTNRELLKGFDKNEYNAYENKLALNKVQMNFKQGKIPINQFKKVDINENFVKEFTELPINDVMEYKGYWFRKLNNHSYIAYVKKP